MKTYVIESFGLDGLKVVDRPEPKPGHGQVLVRWKAFSLNYRDLMVVKGIYNPKLKLPIIPLSDGAGVIEAVGEGVTRFKVGARVTSVFLQDWQAGDLTDALTRTALGGALEGVLAEASVLPEHGLLEVPEHLNFEEAATLPCAALTSWNALVSSGRLKAGDTILVQGTGGVSLFSLQFAKLGGARVVLTSSSDAKLARARELGADILINYKTTPEWGDAARKQAGGAGIDHVVDVGGAGTLAQSMRAVRAGGRISVIGVLAGGGGQLSLLPLLMRNLVAQGIFVGSKAMSEAMNKAISLHKMHPVIDRTFGFDEAPAALRHMESGAHFGKIVVKV
jgi:NADPH:quinone reductase-like Zn-dependent oxidoreductase